MSCTDVTLNAVELSQHLIWQDRESYATVAQQVNNTLSGNLVVFNTSLTGGRPITLIADESTGWLTKAQVDQVRALAKVAGAVYTLVYGDFTTQVMFRHHEPPAFSAVPLIARNTHEQTDYFTCVIKLMEIE